MQNLLRLMFIAVLNSIALPASADVVFRVDLDLSTPGVQENRTVTVGETFDIDFLMEINNTNTVGAFSVGMDFDTAEVDITSTDVTGRPAGFDQINAVVVDDVAGTLRPLDGFSFSTTLDSSFSGLLGRFTIHAVNPTTDGNVDFMPSFQNVAIDGVLDGVSYDPIPLGVVAGDGGVFFRSS